MAASSKSQGENMEEAIAKETVIVIEKGLAKVDMKKVCFLGSQPIGFSSDPWMHRGIINKHLYNM